MQSAVLAIANPSVRPSVRPTLTLSIWLTLRSSGRVVRCSVHCTIS